MPVIHLVRHGQASFGTADYDRLSELGREQSRVVGAELARRGLRRPVLTCGTLRRQQDTAALLADAAGLAPPAPDGDPRWNEYDHLDLIKRYAPDDAPDDAPAEPESSRRLQHRLDAALATWIGHGAADGWAAFADGAAEALHELAGGLTAGPEPARDAVVVTSGGVIAALVGTLLGVGVNGVIAVNRVMVNAAISTVVVGRAGLSLLSFNDHAHLAGDRRLLSYR